MEDAAPRILIVDDARDIREPLDKYLRQQGMRTLTAANANEARVHLEQSNPTLVVLDVMMPGEDGLSLCRWLVAHDGPPVILLTAMADETDKIVGLELGADDYVIKPFNPRELVARIRAVLRRTPAPEPKSPSGHRRFGPWTHDPATQEITHEDGRVIALTSGENRLLSALLAHPQTILSRDRLLDLTSGREAKVYDRAIDNSIGRLRKKIEADPSSPRIIMTEWGGGYRLAAEVEEI
ncbi:MAG: response regulator [Pseudomonadota bacterium]